MTSDADCVSCWHSPSAVICYAESFLPQLHVLRIRSFACDVGLQHFLGLVWRAETCFGH